MIQYTLSCTNRMSQNVQIKVFIEVNSGQPLELGLPSWRPGRYEFQTYARNIFEVHAYDPQNRALPLYKTERNTWIVEPNEQGNVEIRYQYSCTQLDAGGSWVDDVLIYINPINCLFYVKGREEESCTLTLDLPNDSSTIASNLAFKNRTALAEHYFRLADSPFFMSSQQGHETYQVNGIIFHVWTHGEIAYDKIALLAHFRAFTAVQLSSMHVFPEKEYHFLLLLFPFTHYHGVEHQQSTVITLGPAQDLAKSHLYEELISISSHELYHAWNICKIRPAEMYPYRLHEENYFRTGFVVEGITTYLGEYFLRQSGFFSEDRFLLEIEQWLSRHLMHRGLQRASLSDSSFDLWVDGYVGSSADFKVSIYVAGALSAIALDLQIRLANENKSIFDLMRTLYQEKSLKGEGYTEATLHQEIQSLIGKEEQNFWSHCIAGHFVVPYVTKALEEFGIAVKIVSSAYSHERLMGIKFKSTYTKLEVAKLQINSPSATFFMTDDQLLSVNGQTISTVKELEEGLKISQYTKFTVLRKGREVSFSIRVEMGGDYWAMARVEKNSEASDEQKLRYYNWMKDVS